MLEHCVVCGESLDPGGTDHHCDPRVLRENAIARRLAAQIEEPTEAERIAAGFELLNRGDDYE